MAVRIEISTSEQERKVTDYILENADTVRFFSESELSFSHKDRFERMLQGMKAEFLLKESEDVAFMPFMTNDYYSFSLSQRLRESIRKAGIFAKDKDGGPLYSLTEPVFFRKGKMLAEVDCSGARAVMLHIDEEEMNALNSPAKAAIEKPSRSASVPARKKAVRGKTRPSKKKAAGKSKKRS